MLLTRYDITDLNNGDVQEFPVDNPPGWDDISLYYAQALLEMGWQDSPEGDTDVGSMWRYSEDDPTSYYFQAAMHWWPKYPGQIPPSPYDQRWSHCTHGPAQVEPFFLPWHRAYIYFFELIVQARVKSLGGPENWTLPYWNYSYSSGGPGQPWPRANLPWAFCQATLPDGRVNPLYIDDLAKRGLQPKDPQTGDTMYLDPGVPFFAGAWAQGEYFGFNATLDGRPHGRVHTYTGTGNQENPGQGWMTSTVTASFDPVFWLHHAEIDRFWVGWNALGRANPDDPRWLDATGDPFRDTRWNFWSSPRLADSIVIYPGQMVDPANLGDDFPYSYQYENLPQDPPRVAGRRRVAQAVPALARRAPVPADADTRELAASDGPVELRGEPASIDLPLGDDAREVVGRISEDAADEAPRVVLHVDDLAAERPALDYEIYLDYPEANAETQGDVPNFVGHLASFGAEHHHAHGGGENDHEHHGVGARYELTALIGLLRQEGQWDDERATVTFVPAVPASRGNVDAPPLTVGRVSIQAEQ